MTKTENFKKTSDFKLRLLGLALCGLMLGGVVVAGCGDSEDGGEDTTVPKKPGDAPADDQ